MQYKVDIQGELVDVRVRPVGIGTYEVKVGDGPAQVYGAMVDDNQVHLVASSKSHLVRLGDLGEQTYTHLNGHNQDIAVLDSRAARRRVRDNLNQMSSGADVVRSPMPGRVVSVSVTVGQRVTAGQGVVIVEAMKMENELRSEIDGVVKEIHVSADDRVDGDAALVTLEAESGEDT